MGQKLYYGGPILTMEKGGVVEAVLIEEDRIKAVGTWEALRALSQDAECVDLRGKTMLPAFLDAHSHFSACANALLQCSVEKARSFDEIVDLIRADIEEKPRPEGQWVVVRDLDPAVLREKEAPDKTVLDRASSVLPIILQHKSGHVGVLNTPALARAGICDSTPDPVGGRIDKRGGEVTGYLEENAFLAVLKRVPAPTMEALTGAYEETLKWYASYGITTLQEGLMVSDMAPLYQYLCKAGKLWLDVVGYPSATDGDGVDQALSEYQGVYKSGFRLGGYKMFLDGSPQSRTAWMRKPYQGSEDRGYPVLTDAQVYDGVCRALSNRRQILAHCNGDAAAEQFLTALQRAAEEGMNPKTVRPVMIHAQLLGVDQLERLKSLGVIPSFFVAHVYHWGDLHIQNFGLARASAISPAASAGRAGLMYTFHQDAPVIPPNMMETIWCAVNRITRDGVCLGASERISVKDALEAVTIQAAYQYSEEDRKGSITSGKQADLVVLERNPLEIAPMELKDIHILETIKAGKTVFNGRAH